MSSSLALRSTVRAALPASPAVPAHGPASPRRLLPALALALLASAGGALPVHAADWKGYAGVNCLPQNPTDSVRRSAVANPAIANTGAGVLTVYCPVVRDEEVGSPTRVSAVRIRFNNRNSAVNGSCEFASFDIDGTKVDSKSVVAPFGLHTLTMGPVAAHNWGSYVLSCQIPGRDASSNLQSYILSYRVDE